MVVVFYNTEKLDWKSFFFFFIAIHFHTIHDKKTKQNLNWYETKDVIKCAKETFVLCFDEWYTHSTLVKFELSLSISTEFVTGAWYFE